jgi:hypothetical protein
MGGGRNAKAPLTHPGRVALGVRIINPRKLLAQEQELYVLAQSQDRVNKERAMRRRQLKGLWQRLK